jgi:hypothetical protein
MLTTNTVNLAAQLMAPLHLSKDKLPAVETPSRCLRPRKTVNYKEQHCEDDEDVIVVEPPKAVVERPGPVFETFTSNIEIKDGLHLIRSLGGGKYGTSYLHAKIPFPMRDPELWSCLTSHQTE